MNVLITGGYGFIGSHIADEFFKEGHRIFIIDNLSTGSPKNIKFKHTFYNVDISDEGCREIFKSNHFDIIIHLAAQISVPDSFENPCKDSMSNIVGLTNMLQLSSDYNVKKFVFSSSAAIYGSNENIPLKENALPDPLSPYGISKTVGEYYCNKWNELYGIDVLCFRFSNVYGPRQGMRGEGGVVSIFIDRAVRGKEIEIFGDGNQTRDFIYVRDLSNAIYKAVENDLRGVYNLSTNTEISINELLNTIIDMKPIKEIIYKPEREGDIKHSSLDNTRLLHDLNWKPSHSFRDGLKSTYDWYMSYNKEMAKKIKVSDTVKSTPNRTSLIIIENLLLFALTCFMTVISQNSLNYFFVDYKMIYIILSGAIYGLKFAVISSVLSCALHIYLYIDKGRELSSIFYDPGNLLQLSFYILIALIFGYVIDIKNDQIQDKDMELSSLKKRHNFLHSVHEETLKVQNELYEQIISSENSYGKVNSILTKLNNLNPDEVLIDSVSVLEKIMKTDRISIYVFNDDTATLSAKSNAKDFLIPKMIKIAEREDMRNVLETYDVYVNNMWAPFLPIMAAPIMCKKSVIGVACIHKLPFESISLHKQNLFKTIVNLISYSYENACKYSEKSQHKYINYMAATNQDNYLIKHSAE